MLIICTSWPFPKIMWYWVNVFKSKSISKPESYQYIRNLERLGAKIPSTISYRIKIPGTMNTLDLTWFILLVISNIKIRAWIVICLLTLCLYLPHSYTVCIKFVQPFYFLITKSYHDYIQCLCNISSCVVTTSILKIFIVQKHMSLMSPDKKSLTVNFMFALWSAT